MKGLQIWFHVCPITRFAIRIIKVYSLQCVELPDQKIFQRSSEVTLKEKFYLHELKTKLFVLFCTFQICQCLLVFCAFIAFQHPFLSNHVKADLMTISQFSTDCSYYDVIVNHNVIVMSHINGWYLFWYQWKDDIHSYTLIVNLGVSDLPY